MSCTKAFSKFRCVRRDAKEVLQMDFIRETNRIYLNEESGKLLAEITFPEVTDHIVNINHTFVDESLGAVSYTHLDVYKRQAVFR